MEKLDTALSYIQLYTGCNDHTKNRIKHLLESMDCFTIEQIVLPQKIETKTITLRYTKKKISIEPLDKWVVGYCNRKKITEDVLKIHSRKAENVKIRDKFCRVAYKCGYTITEIANYLNKHHTSILHSLYKPQ